VHDPIKAARPSGIDLHETGAHDPARDPRATSQTPALGGRLGSHVNLYGGRVPVAVQPASNTPPAFLTPAALAERHHTTRGHLANLRLRRQGVPWMKRGARVLYAYADVLAYEAAGRVETSAA
jgi:hypothetical protein